MYQGQVSFMHIYRKPLHLPFHIRDNAEAILDKISGQVIAIPPCIQAERASSVIILKNINVYITPNSLQI